MQHTNKTLLRMLLFFYLFSSVVSATHIHHDAEISHDNCSICIVVKNLHSGDITPAFTLDKIVYTYHSVIPWVEHYTRYINLKYTHAQAPPLFS